MTEPDALDAALAAIGVSPNLWSRWREEITYAVAQARLDYARYRSRSVRSALRKRITILLRLANRAWRRDQCALEELIAEVGDGLILDCMLDDVAGFRLDDPPDPVSRLGRQFAADPPRWVSTLAATLEHAELAETPQTRARRSLKLFATVYLALIFAELTGRRPTAGTDLDGNRTGDFATIVVAAGTVFDLDPDGKGFERTIPDALFASQIEIETTLSIMSDHGFVPDLPRFGSPSFMELRREKSDDLS